MDDSQHSFPPTVPATPSYRLRLDRQRQKRDRLDAMLQAYWAALIKDSEPVAEALLERALKDAALAGTTFV